MVLTSSSVWALGRLPALVDGGVHSGHLSVCAVRTPASPGPGGGENLLELKEWPLLHGSTRCPGGRGRGGEGSGRSWTRGRAWVFNE